MKEKIGIGVGVLILNHHQEVLLLLRNEDPQLADSDMRLEGTYTLPAGKVIYGETFESAAVRKVKEETNLEILNPSVISLANDINDYAHYVTIGLLVTKYQGEVSLGTSREHIHYLWCSLDQLPENLCEPSKEIINHYLKNKIY